MVRVKYSFGLLAALAVVSVALPGTTQWSNSDGRSNGVGAGHSGGGTGGQGGSNGFYAGGGRGGSEGQGGGKGFEGANGQGGDRGDSRAGGNGEQGHGGNGSGGSHGNTGNSASGAHRRHENSGNPNGNYGTSGTGTDGGKSWDHMGNSEGRPADHEGQGSPRGGGSGANRSGGIRARDDEVDAIKDIIKSVHDPNDKQRHARDEVDAIKDIGYKSIHDPNDKQRHARSPEDEQDDIPDADDGHQVDIEFSRRWAQAVEDDDAPDIRFQFDSDHPYAQVNTLNTRGAGLGVYECAHTMYTPPCHFQEIVAGECYNR
jgi:hypothetical protein